MNNKLSSLAKIKFPLTITKMSGTGNDFIIIDHRQEIIPQDIQAEVARRVCRRKFSAGADGLIFIENCPEMDFQWKFYNADGSNAEMCGNGARCAARYAYAKGIAPTKMRFKTIAGPIEAEVTADDMVRLKMTPPENICLEKRLLLDGQEVTMSSINTGVPHVVCFVDDVSQVPLDRWGKTIRYHDLFMPAGTNVNFAQILSPQEIHVRTYERGVEGETLACGTGAVASAVIAGLAEKALSPVAVTTSGGEQLTIHFILANHGKQIEEVFLEGRARFVYEGQLHPEAL